MTECEHPLGGRIEDDTVITCGKCGIDLYYLETGEDYDYWEWAL